MIDDRAIWCGKPICHLAQTRNKIVRILPDTADRFYQENKDTGRHIGELMMAHKVLKMLEGKEVPVLENLDSAEPVYLVPVVPSVFHQGQRIGKACVAVKYTEVIEQGFSEAS